MMMNMSQEEYKKYADTKAPKSNLWVNMIKAFLIGGLICTIGQGILDFYKSIGLQPDDAATMTSVTLIFISAVLTAFNVYDNIAKHGGAGTLVPITGFANAVVAPAMEYKSEGFITGVGAKMFTIAGPVIVFGTIASVIAGIVFLFL